jgi:hypothetical protein
MLMENPFALEMDAAYRRDQAQRAAARAAQGATAASTQTGPRADRADRPAFITRALGVPRLLVPGRVATLLGRPAV